PVPGMLGDGTGSRPSRAGPILENEPRVRALPVAPGLDGTDGLRSPRLDAWDQGNATMLNRTGSALFGRNAWRSFLALGLALTGVYLLLPRGGLAGGIVYVSLGVAMTAAIAVGIAIYRPSPRLPWLLLLAGTALYTTLG